MRRVRLTVLIVSATALGVLSLPAAAQAGTFTWSLPANFTTTGGGSNPDHDFYGAAPWSYLVNGAGGSSSGFTKLPVFSSSYSYPLTGLVGWGDDPQNPSALIATNPTGAAISSAPYTFPAGQLVVRPASNQSVAIGWTSPLPGSATVTVTGSVSSDAPSGCLFSGYSWSLDQNGTGLQSSAGAGNISATPTVPAGGSIYLVLSPSLVYSAACATASVSLTIQANGSAPQVTLSSPANGALLGSSTPTFSGSASSGFGVSGQVTVRIYHGASASGAPVQILTAAATGGGYSVTPSSSLADGLYTAQAEQQDRARPPDSGLSGVSLFVIDSAAPQIRLSSPGSGPLKSANPTLSGTAGTAGGDAGSVRLLVYPGPDTTGTPVRALVGPVDHQGRFSVPITPKLADGEYTAVAAQDGPGSSVGFSNLVGIRIKLHPPAVTLTMPAPYSNTSSSSQVFAGSAGSTIDDDATVTVRLYSGASARGKPLGSMITKRSGATWSGTWPHLLGLGLYTVVATQQDDVGHTGRTRANTFLIVAPPSVIGAGVGVIQNGQVAVPVTCSAPPGQTCSGNVLVSTAGSFRPVADGPSGHLSVMFAYVILPGASTTIVFGRMQPVVRRALHHTGLAVVKVTTLLSAAGGRGVTSTATRLIGLR